MTDHEQTEEEKQKKLARMVGFRVTEEQYKLIKKYLCPEDFRYAIMEYIANVYED